MFSSHYEEEEAPVEFLSKVEEYYLHFFNQAIEIVVNCIRNRFQQKDHIETLQKMEIQWNLYKADTIRSK